jgi:hypothetical protein
VARILLGRQWVFSRFRPNGLFVSAKQHAFNLIRCVYDTRKQRKLCQYLIGAFVDESLGTRKGLQDGGAPEQIKGLLVRYQWSLALAMVTSSLMRAGFEEEMEWRLVSQYPDEVLYGVAFRPGRFGVTPYFELPLDTEQGPRSIDEIVIGPTANKPAAREAPKMLLLKHHSEVPVIKLS